MRTHTIHPSSNVFPFISFGWMQILPAIVDHLPRCAPLMEPPWREG
jgi:hypothetical protein